MKYLGFGLLAAVAFLVVFQVAPMIRGNASAQRRPENQVFVSRAWGKVAGVAAGMGGIGIVFEASDGTIRFVDAAKGTVELTITRN